MILETKQSSTVLYIVIYYNCFVSGWFHSCTYQGDLLDQKYEHSPTDQGIFLFFPAIWFIQRKYFQDIKLPDLPQAIKDLKMWGLFLTLWLFQRHPVCARSWMCCYRIGTRHRCHHSVPSWTYFHDPPSPVLLNVILNSFHTGRIPLLILWSDHCFYKELSRTSSCWRRTN